MGRYILSVERNRLAKLVLAGGRCGGVAALQHAERGMEVGPVGVDGECVLNLSQRFSAVALGHRNA